MKINKTTVKILGIIESDIPLHIILEKFCLLRACKKVGDIETINNYQLGKLNFHGVIFETIN